MAPAPKKDTVAAVAARHDDLCARVSEIEKNQSDQRRILGANRDDLVELRRDFTSLHNKTSDGFAALVDRTDALEARETARRKRLNDALVEPDRSWFGWRSKMLNTILDVLFR